MEKTGIETDEKMMEILIDATTSELESFNNHLLMYAPKRNAFSYAVYRCRRKLEGKECTQKLLVIGAQDL
ncbi:hypothetical protein DPMN_138382 [Dreissena polymorpha]|uniref:Uncharacterized protein n=1 Tax=Dreissena polymorpha TaxID=45954 RepID=A0A9D4G7I0_DREPO|nr:hypothetical protein DPMN_138382 [Dreissena polymorpha]